MTRLRLTPLFRSTNPICLTPRTFLVPTSLHHHPKRLYAGGSSYGGGEGDPKGENPQDQGSNPSAELEHPGPAPPDVGKSTGGGPTKKGADGHNTLENESSSGGSGGGGGNGAPQPKIHKHEAPGEKHHSEEVRAHNEDMGRRHDRAEVKSPDKDDKVDKGFWSGQGGADRNP